MHEYLAGAAEASTSGGAGGSGHAAGHVAAPAHAQRGAAAAEALLQGAGSSSWPGGSEGDEFVYDVYVHVPEAEAEAGGAGEGPGPGVEPEGHEGARAGGWGGGWQGAPGAGAGAPVIEVGACVAGGRSAELAWRHSTWVHGPAVQRAGLCARRPRGGPGPTGRMRAALLTTADHCAAAGRGLE